MKNKFFRRDLLKGICLSFCGALMVLVCQKFELEFSGTAFLMYGSIALGVLLAGLVWILQQSVCYLLHLQMRRNFSGKTVQAKVLMLYDASDFRQNCYLDFCEYEELELLKGCFLSMDAQLQERSVRARRLIYHFERCQKNRKTQA